MKFFKNTRFPRFKVKDETPPDLAESTCSSTTADENADEHNNGKLDVRTESDFNEKYQTKEQEDVAVFLELAKQMSISSLLFLLQNTVKKQNFPGAYGHDLIFHDDDDDDSVVKPLPKIKKFRFAEVNGNQVRAIIHNVDCVENMCPKDEIWWTDQEMTDIRMEAIMTVRSFRKFMPQLAVSIRALAESATKDSFRLERHMKRMTTENSSLSAARGLEIHIVDFLAEVKNQTVTAVMKAQKKSRDKKLSYDESCENIREASLEASIAAQTLAAKMAECDQITALTACLASWAPEP